LTAISWMVTLVEPLLTLFGYHFSGRDMILIGGGLFLVFKATMELDERLEGTAHQTSTSKTYAGFWMVISQIVILDAVFSLDAVITAVGMVDELWVMMTAVVIAMAVMIAASKPLTLFVNRHPTLVILCLGFLLMIGFTLIADGFGVHIPKGYLYGAIGFSILIEVFNQIGRRKTERREAKTPLRTRTAEAILRMLGSRPAPESVAVETNSIETTAHMPAFLEEERYMISGVLSLANRSVRRIMTARSDISFIDVDWSPERIRAHLRRSTHSMFPVCRDSLDDLLGVMQVTELFTALEEGEDLRTCGQRHPPQYVSDKLDAIQVLDALRASGGRLVFVVDDAQHIVGLVTPLDLLEAIAGDFPDADETADILADGSGWLAKGSADLYQVSQTLGATHLVQPDDEYLTLAGLLLAQSDNIPSVGDNFRYGDLQFEVVQASPYKVEQVRIQRLPPEEG
jgi:CBS domain containing-hemolysin-like protein